MAGGQNNSQTDKVAGGRRAINPLVSRNKHPGTSKGRGKFHSISIFSPPEGECPKNEGVIFSIP